MKPRPAESLMTPLEWLYRLGWLALFLWVVLTFKQYGISNDEYVQHVYGQMLLDWYHSGFTDQDAFHYRNLYLYGGLFDIIAAAIDPYIPMTVWDIRHLLSAGFGLLGFYAVSRFAYLLDGRVLSVLSICLLFLTVSWSGTMMTHTKDIPFAACMMWALYAIALVVRNMENVSGKVIVLLGLSIGCALGLRVGGVFAVLYLIILVAWRIWLDHRASGTPVVSRLLKMFTVLLPAAILAFVFMAICWPWSVIEADNLMEAIKSFSHFEFNMQTIADGVVYNINAVPRTYLLQYLAVKLPEAELLGLVALVLLWLCCRKKLAIQDTQTRLTMHTLLLAIFIPLLFVMHDRPVLYNGVRHFTFLLPPLAILGSWGIIVTWRRLPAFTDTINKSTLYQALWSGCIAGLMLVTLVDIIQLHPYQYVRLNRLAGDPIDAQYKWEGDYWSSALREASKQLLALKLPKKDSPYWVGACVDTPQIEPYLDDRFKITRNWDESDFYMSTTHMHCHEVMQGTPIIRVERMGMLLAVVKDRRMLHGKDRASTPAKN